MDHIESWQPWLTSGIPQLHYEHACSYFAMVWDNLAEMYLPGDIGSNVRMSGKRDLDCVMLLICLGLNAVYRLPSLFTSRYRRGCSRLSETRGSVQATFSVYHSIPPWMCLAQQTVSHQNVKILLTCEVWACLPYKLVPTLLYPHYNAGSGD